MPGESNELRPPLRTVKTTGDGQDIASCSDEELFTAFLEGSDAAFVELHRRLHTRILMYSERLLRSREGAMDVAQSVWERVIAMRSAPRPVASPVGLILRMTRNLCLDILKSPRHRQVPLEVWQEQTTADDETKGDMVELVEEVLQELPTESREVLVMNLYMGYKFDEIAGILGRTPEAIWARASRARADLRRRIAAKLARGTGTERPSILARRGR